jgi:hypothetical protein
MARENARQLHHLVLLGSEVFEYFFFSLGFTEREQRRGS